MLTKVLEVGIYIGYNHLNTQQVSLYSQTHVTNVNRAIVPHLISL